MWALQAGGAAGLEAHLAAEREAALPEFKRHRPKYYYYYEWMKKRIYAQVRWQGAGRLASHRLLAQGIDSAFPSDAHAEVTLPCLQYPELPEAVMDKLLALEANELDMVLQYPRATQVMVRIQLLKRRKLPCSSPWRMVAGACVRRHGCLMHIAATQHLPAPGATACGCTFHCAPPPFNLGPASGLPHGPPCPAPLPVRAPPLPAQVERLLDVLRQEGPERLEAYEVPLLSWDDYQAMKEEPLALPAGDGAAAAAGGRLLADAASGAAGAAQAGAADERAAAAGGAAVQRVHASGPGPAGLAAGVSGLHSEAGSEEGELDGAASEAGSIDVEAVDDLFELD